MGGVQETLKYKQVPVYRWAKLHLSSRSNSADQQIQQTFQVDQADQIQADQIQADQIQADQMINIDATQGE